MATVNCPKCSGGLEVLDDDLRGEWERITYYCKACDRKFSRLITFKTQSSMTESDEWEGLEPVYIVLVYDENGDHPIVSLLEVEEDTPEGAITEYLIEQHDWDIEDVIAAKDKIRYFYIDPKVADRIDNIKCPEWARMYPDIPDAPTRMEAGIKLATFKAFRIRGEDKCMK